jgi:IS30 family transposase
LPSKRAEPVAGTLTAVLQALPPACRKTVTFDNGTDTYFCDPHAPWQKGGIENAIGRMRRFLPRKTDLADLDTGTLLGMMAAYNNTPRKCLAYRTPAEAFSQQVLHFKCESTSPPARG